MYITELIKLWSTISIGVPNTNKDYRRFFLSFFYDPTTLERHGLLIAEVSRSQSDRHTTFGRNPLDDGSARRRDLLPDNTQESDIHAAGGI
jgi:hypothetical protein